jgi:hypothetical protein
MDSMEPKTPKAILKESTVTRPGRTKFANLKEQIAYGPLLPTPEAANQEGYNISHGKRVPKIGRVVRLLPTPDAYSGSRGGARQYDPKGKSQSSRTIDSLIGTGTGKKLRLQPAMTQWMMGYPDLWTEFPTAEPSGASTVSKPTGTGL